MSSDPWPSPDAAPSALPRLEDLPIAEQGYDQEAVRRAFDSFYRHAAQLDVSLRALDAVEAFRRDADALRTDLRALRALGLEGGAFEAPFTAGTYERPAREVSGVVFRLAAEAALIVAVAVVAGVAHFRGFVIVALMAGAFLVVAICEWLAARARFVPPVVAFLPELDDLGEPAPYVEAPAPAWQAPPLGPGEDTQPDALTVVEPRAALEEGGGEDEGDGLPAVDPWEQFVAPEPEPELAERGGLFRRRRR